MMPDVDDDDVLVEFPSDKIRYPSDGLPRVIGRIDETHPLKRPLAFILAILAFILVAFVIYSAIFPPPDNRAGSVNQYHESGAITYEGDLLKGWFSDAKHQGFVCEDGREFTYVDPHHREGAQVRGHWRLLESD